MSKWTTDVARSPDGAWIATFSKDEDSEAVVGTGPTPAAAFDDAAAKTTDDLLLSAIESARESASILRASRP